MANGQDQDQENWKPSGPPSGWKPSGAPPGFGRPSEAQQAAALGPRTMQAAHAETQAPLTNEINRRDAFERSGGVNELTGVPETNEEALSDVDRTNLALLPVGGGAEIAEKGFAKAAGPLIRGVSGAVAGSAAGGYGGRQIGTMIGGKGGGETGARVGATLGGLGGGLYGGLGFNEPTPEPEVFPVAKAPGPYRGPSSVPKPIDPMAPKLPASVAEGPAYPSPKQWEVSRQAPIDQTLASHPTLGPTAPAPTEAAGPSLFESGAGVREPARVGNEGSAARWTNERAYELARQGNREALMTLERRGIQPPPNTRYVMGSPDFGRVTYNPREVTTFEPSGEPIRNMETPERGARARIITPQRGIQGTPVPIPETGTTQTGEGESALEQARRGAPGESPTDKSIRRKSEKGGFTKPITRKPKPKSD